MKLFNKNKKETQRVEQTVEEFEQVKKKVNAEGDYEFEDDQIEVLDEAQENQEDYPIGEEEPRPVRKVQTSKPQPQAQSQSQRQPQRPTQNKQIKQKQIEQTQDLEAQQEGEEKEEQEKEIQYIDRPVYLTEAEIINLLYKELQDVKAELFEHRKALLHIVNTLEEFKQ